MIRTIWLSLSVVLMTALLGCARPICQELLAPQWGGEGRLNPSQVVLFHGCYDGDTCKFTFLTLPPLFGERVPIRLAGIDTRADYDAFVARWRAASREHREGNRAGAVGEAAKSA